MGIAAIASKVAAVDKPALPARRFPYAFLAAPIRGVRIPPTQENVVAVRRDGAYAAVACLVGAARQKRPAVIKDGANIAVVQARAPVALLLTLTLVSLKRRGSRA